MPEEEPLIARKTYQLLIVLSAITFLVLPFVSTFNEFLTAVIMKIQLYTFIQDIIVPIEVRMVGAILQYFFGIQTSVSSQSLYLQSAGRVLSVYISWNCIGWQSVILFVFTLIVGLQGPYTITSKILCLLIGFQGTILVNLARIVLVVLVALYWGYLPAIVFHDYGGTIFILLWLVLFWHVSFKYILEHYPVEAEQTITQEP